MSCPVSSRCRDDIGCTTLAGRADKGSTFHHVITNIHPDRDQIVPKVTPRVTGSPDRLVLSYITVRRAAKRERGYAMSVWDTERLADAQAVTSTDCDLVSGL
jgi:hypothetical protein